MSDYQDLSAALQSMREAEGKLPKDKLVWGVLASTIDDQIHSTADRLSEELRRAQEEHGSQRPVCGKMLAVEVLAKIGMLLNEEKEE
jgi:hypothetical protein